MQKLFDKLYKCFSYYFTSELFYDLFKLDISSCISTIPKTTHLELMQYNTM